MATTPVIAQTPSQVIVEVAEADSTTPTPTKTLDFDDIHYKVALIEEYNQMRFEPNTSTCLYSIAEWLEDNASLLTAKESIDAYWDLAGDHIEHRDYAFENENFNSALFHNQSAVIYQKVANGILKEHFSETNKCTEPDFADTEAMIEEQLANLQSDRELIVKIMNEQKPHR
ncbi:MAG: hypothetical protein ACPGUD_06960 [Parashewanella sp.]